MPDKEIKLPKARIKGELSLEEAIAKRRSKRSFVRKDLSYEQIAQLLWAAQGFTDKRSELRAAPSAGALYPMEIYITYKDGLFHYIPEEHILERVSDRDVRQYLFVASYSQEAVRQAAADIIICAVYEKMTHKYAKRGVRFTDMEAGHIAQNIHLQAEALGLGSVAVGAFDDVQVKSILELPKHLEPIYIVPVGYTQ